LEKQYFRASFSHFFLLFFVLFLTLEQSKLTSKYIHNSDKIKKFLLQKLPRFNISHGYVTKKGFSIPKIYLNRQDTSCPLAQNEEGRIDKMPNLIAVGFAKCGTGSLSFLDCHSQIGIPRTTCNYKLTFKSFASSNHIFL